VSVEDLGLEEDLCDGLELHPSWTWDFPDPLPGVVIMPKCPSRAQSLSVGTGASAPKISAMALSSTRLHLICVTQGGVLLIVFMVNIIVVLLLLWLLLSRRVQS
jgi:hypothetical protein